MYNLNNKNVGLMEFLRLDFESHSSNYHNLNDTNIHKLIVIRTCGSKKLSVIKSKASYTKIGHIIHFLKRFKSAN